MSLLNRAQLQLKIRWRGQLRQRVLMGKAGEMKCGQHREHY